MQFIFHAQFVLYAKGRPPNKDVFIFFFIILILGNRRPFLRIGVRFVWVITYDKINSVCILIIRKFETRAQRPY